jgi:hypothetical protein
MGTFLDLTGKRFGKLIAISYSPGSRRNEGGWLCKCDCGKDTFVSGANLRTGNTKSCGCLVFKNIAGQKFGKLTVLKQDGFSRNGEALWLCRCECGNEKIINGSNLRRGHIVSCGCKSPNYKHGMRNSLIYKKHAEMLCRCRNKNNPLYGGRGITVCDQWHRFEPFYEWALSTGYHDGLSLDRIDPNGNYEPSNCRWADSFVQAQNQRVARNNSTGISGVYPKGDKFACSITANGKRKHLGTFETIEEAKEVRIKAEFELWGWSKTEAKGGVENGG